MEVLFCGGEVDLWLVDMVVVEFMIGDDGVVRSILLIYVVGGGVVVLEFVCVVCNWLWIFE